MARTQTPKKNAKEVTNKSSVTKKKGEKGERKKPKLSAYNLFCKEQYAIHKESNNELKPTEIMKLVGADWTKLDSDARVAYQKQADAKNASEGKVETETAANEEAADEEGANEEGGEEEG